MAQTTGAKTSVDGKLEYSQDGTTWVDISGVTNSVTPGGGERTVTETPTLGTEEAIITVGRRGRVTLEIIVLYTEVDAEAFNILYNTYYGAKAPLYMRISPQGGQTGEYQFSGGPGYINKGLPPALVAGSEETLKVTFTWNGPKFTQADAT
jgi:hypothetical protein